MKSRVLGKNAVKRAHYDYTNYLKSDLKDHGVYCIQDEEDILHYYALIIGPDDTPYQGGFYLFDIHLHNNHPFEAPSVKFCTSGKKVRFNPNLYVNGKVCLSILGTWSGPPWVATMNICTLLLSIQSLLHNNPIINEPGFSGYKLESELSKNYNLFLTYHNIEISLISMFSNHPSIFKCFKDTMKTYLQKNKDKYISLMDKLQKYDKKSIDSSTFCHNNFTFDYNILKKQFDDFITKI